MIYNFLKLIDSLGIERHHDSSTVIREHPKGIYRPWYTLNLWICKIGGERHLCCQALDGQPGCSVIRSCCKVNNMSLMVLHWPKLKKLWCLNPDILILWLETVFRRRWCVNWMPWEISMLQSIGSIKSSWMQVPLSMLWKKIEICWLQTGKIQYLIHLNSLLNASILYN